MFHLYVINSCSRNELQTVVGCLLQFVIVGLYKTQQTIYQSQ